ncbi:MAG: cytidylate kinase-like family protein [Candidatus Hodarchaeales archaeon]|jgi:cytidylate kinase
MGTFVPFLRDIEKRLLEENSRVINSRTTPIIAIGGFSGTGKDTVASFVQQYYERKHQIPLKITGAGDFVRKIAIESGWKEKNLDEFMKHIQITQNKDFARKVDIRIERYALKTALLEGGIFIGRMAPYAIGTHGITIWLEVAARVVANRISRDVNRSEYGLNVEELIQKIKSRDRTDGERLEQIYGITFRDKKNFDLTLRNEGWTLDELKERIDEFLSIKSSQKHGDKKNEP